LALAILKKWQNSYGVDAFFDYSTETMPDNGSKHSILKSFFSSFTTAANKV
jgi:hypothetical protein